MFFIRSSNRKSQVSRTRLAEGLRKRRRALFLENLEDRRVLATLYVDQPADFAITNDLGNNGLSTGDTVSWRASPSSNWVTGLTFGTNAFSTIQSAVTAANSGDLVLAAEGTYAETVTISGSKNLTVRGAVGIPNNVVVSTGGGTGFTVTSTGNVSLEQMAISGAATALSANGPASLKLVNMRTIASTAGGSLSNIGTLNIETGGGGETVRVNVDGSNAVAMGQFSVSGQLLSTTYATIGTIALDTTGGADVIKVAGSPTTLIDVDAGDGADSLDLIGGTATNVEHRFVNNSSGSIWYDATQVVTYVALEPIVDTTTATTRTFTFTSANGETITLSDDASVGNGSSKIDSTEGESVVFTNPADALLIQTQANGGGGADTVSVQGLDSLYGADLNITAGLDDSVQFTTNATNLGAGILDVASGSIQVNQNVTTTTDIILDATNGSITGTGLLSAATADLRAFNNVGTSNSLLNTSVDNLEADAGGGVYVTNNKALVIGGVSPNLAGISAGGSVDVRAYGALNINDPCFVDSVNASALCESGVNTTSGSILLQARETTIQNTTSDVINIAFGNGVATQDGSVTLNAGDGVFGGTNTVISATASVTINVDNAAGNIGSDNDIGSGGAVDLASGASDTEVVAPDGATILGGNDDDIFEIGDSTAFADADSVINGFAGADTLDVSQFNTARLITLTGLGTIDGYQGNQRELPLEGEIPPGASFDNIDTIIGTSLSDYLHGPDRGNYWDLSGAFDPSGDNSGTLSDLQSTDPDVPTPPCNCDEEPDSCDGGGGGGSPDIQDIDFISFENIIGGTLQDWFDLAPGFDLSGFLDGGGNLADAGDTLDYRARTTVVVVDLAAGSATGITGGLASGDADDGSSIEDVLGGEGNDTIRGDSDLNLLRGFVGADILNGRGAADNVDGGAGTDTLEVSGSEALDDVIVGGSGSALDTTDKDTMLNVGGATVFLRTFNTSATTFANSIDVFDGAGQSLSGADDVSQLHLGFTDVINTTSVLGAADNDSVTTGYASNLNGGTGPVTYDGGDGTSDSVLLTFQSETFAAFLDQDITALHTYLNNPTGATLDLSTNPLVNLIAMGFESAGLAVYDDGQVYNITACFGGIMTAAQIFVGTSGADTLVGTSNVDLMFGLGGNDILTGLLSSDCIFGGAGDDSIGGGGGWDQLVGGSGADTIHGDDGIDTIYGGSGGDTLYGDNHPDYLYGQDGNDVIFGGTTATTGPIDEADYMEGNAGNDTLWGGPGNDNMLGGADDDYLDGGAGSDQLNGGAGVDQIFGQADNDDIQTQADESEFDFLRGGGGEDRISNIDQDGTPAPLVFDSFDGQNNEIELIMAYFARIIGNTQDNTLDFRKDNAIPPVATVTIYNAASIEGCQGNDTIYGTLGLDSIYGNAGNDLLYGFASNDFMFGGTGNDTLYGGVGADNLFGGNGNDTLYGETENDTLHGDGGVDQLFGQDGADTLEGGLGGDTLSGGAQDDTLLTQGLEGIQDSYDGGTGNDRLTNSSFSAAPPMSITTFDGKTNSIEFVYAYGAEIWGDDGAGPAQALLDFRRNAAATLFVDVQNLAAIRGAAVAYTIHGSNAADVISGLAGDDQIYGYGGNDQIDGGTGNDTVFGGAGADSLTGGDDNDTLNGDTENDTILGGNGNDILNGGDGNDILTGGEGNDQNSGGAGNDEYRMSGTEAGGDTFSDSAGTADRLTNTGGAATPMALGNFTGPTAGIESIYANGAQITGTAGDDTIDFRLQNVANPTTFVVLFNVPSINGLAGNDTIRGTNGIDTIYGGAGNDQINSYGGNDLLYGEADNDTIFGGVGNDVIYGGTGADVLNGDTENDTIYGEAGADTLDGGDGADTLNGVLDVDSVNGGLGNDDIQTQGAESTTDTLQGGGGTGDRLTNIGGAATPLELTNFLGQSNGIEFIYANGAEIWGTNAVNTLDFRLTVSTWMTLFNVPAIRGLDGNDTIHGSNAADTIYGGNGDDSLFGYGGNDFLEGGLGLDSLTGGTGADVFSFVYSATDVSELDTINDWSADYIRLSGYLTSYGTIGFTPATNTLFTNTANGTRNKSIKLTGVVTKPASMYFQLS